MSKYLRNPFYVDYRSLALFRVFLGLILFIDFILRLNFFEILYLNSGALPWDYFKELAFYTNFSLLAGKSFTVAIFFFLAIICALFFTIGLWTRWVHFFLFLFVSSLHSRNPLVLSGGDELIRFLLFWSLFLPLNSYFSLDRALMCLKGKETRNEKTETSIFSFCLLFQVATLYLFSAVSKTSEDWRLSFRAVEYALNIDMLTSDLGRKLLAFPKLLKFASGAVVSLEATLPLLVFAPFFNSFIRNFVIGSFLVFHTFLFLFMDLYIFPFACFAAWFVFIPETFWHSVYRFFYRRGRTGAGGTVFYDGGCGICRKIAFMLREFLLLPDLSLRPAQDDQEQKINLMHLMHLKMKTENSWIYRDKDGICYTRFIALFRLMGDGNWTSPLGLLNHLLGKRLEPLYRFIASHRFILAYLIPFSRPLSTLPVLIRFPFLRRVLGGGVLGLALSVFSYNLYSSAQLIERQKFSVILKPFFLEQSWTLFAPRPYRDDGYFIVRGTSYSGVNYNLQTLKRKEASWERDAPLDGRLAQFYRSLWQSSFAPLRIPFIHYFCRRFAEMERIQFFMVDDTTPNLETGEPAPHFGQKHLLGEQYCAAVR